MVLALVETATRSTTTEAGVSISNSDVGAEVTFEGGDSRCAGKSGAISFAQRARRGREHLSRYSENRFRKPTGGHHLVAGADRSFRERLRRQRYANERAPFTNEIGIRPRLLYRDRGGASWESETSAEHARLSIPGLRSFSRSDELVRKSRSDSSAWPRRRAL